MSTVPLLPQTLPRLVAIRLAQARLFGDLALRDGFQGMGGARLERAAAPPGRSVEPHSIWAVNAGPLPESPWKERNLRAFALGCAMARGP